MPLTLVGYPVSPFVRKARVALETKEIAYALEPVVPYTEREKVLRWNPAGTVPVLVPETAQPITESAEIVTWAEAAVPLPSLIPQDPAARNRAMQIEQFADTQMAQVFGGMIFGQRIVVPFYLGKSQGREAVVEQAINDYAPLVLNSVADLLKNEDFVLGSFSVADISMASWLRAAEMAGFELDAGKWPKIATWLVRCFEQPGFARVIASEEQLEVVKWARENYCSTGT